MRASKFRLTVSSPLRFQVVRFVRCLQPVLGAGVWAIWAPIFLGGGVSLAASAPVADPASAAEVEIDRVFRDLAAQAIEKAPDLRIADVTASQKGAQKYTAYARWLPRLDFQLTRSSSLDYSIVTSGALGANSAFFFRPAEVQLARWMLSFSAPLYRRSVHVNLMVAIAERDQALVALESRRGEFEFRFRNLLGNYLLQQYRVATIQSSIEAAKSSLREARLRFELGEKTKVDVLRAEANLLSLESSRFEVEQKRASDLSALLSFSGLTVADLGRAGFSRALTSEAVILKSLEKFTDTHALEAKLQDYLLPAEQLVKASAPADPLPPSDVTLSLQTQADSASPWVRIGPELQRKIERQLSENSAAYQSYLKDEDVTRTRALTGPAQEWPELVFQGNWNKQGPGWSEAFQSGSISHSYALVLNVPLFTWGTTGSTYIEASRAREAASIKSEKDRFEFLSQVEDGLIQIQTLRRNLDSLKLKRSQSEEIVRLSFKSYQLGKGTFFELLSSQNDLITAKQNLAQARTDLANLMGRVSWQLGVKLQ